MRARKLPPGDLSHSCAKWDHDVRGGDVMEVVGRVLRSTGHSPLLREPVVLDTWGLAYQTLLAHHLTLTHNQGVSETALRLRTSDQRIEQLLRLLDRPVSPKFAGLATRPTERAVLPIVLSAIRPAEATSRGEALLAQRLSSIPDRPYPGVARDILAAYPEEFAHLGEMGLRGLLNRLEGRAVTIELTPSDVSTPEFEDQWRKGRVAGIDGAVFGVRTGRVTFAGGFWVAEVIHVPVMVIAGGYPEVPITVSIGDEAGDRGESLVHYAADAGMRAPVTIMYDGHGGYRTNAFRLACNVFGFRHRPVKYPAENPAERVIRNLKECVPFDVSAAEFPDCLGQAIPFLQAMGMRAG